MENKMGVRLIGEPPSAFPLTVAAGKPQVTVILVDLLGRGLPRPFGPVPFPIHPCGQPVPFPLAVSRLGCFPLLRGFGFLVLPGVLPPFRVSAFTVKLPVVPFIDHLVSQKYNRWVPKVN
jgi:hypothetical protein